MNFEKLEWDTKFFKQDVYKAEVNSAADINEAIARSTKGSMVYAISQVDIPEFKPELMDHRLTFAVDLNPDETYRYADGIVDYDGSNFPKNDMERLTIACGVHSRFRIDKKVNPKLVDEMYRIWLNNAITQDQFHIMGKILDNQMVGFHMLKFFPTYLRMDLLGVDERFQGRGIAKELIFAGFALARKHNLPQVQLFTQAENPAGFLYRKLGFKVTEEKYIYHIHP